MNAHVAVQNVATQIAQLVSKLNAIAKAAVAVAQKVATVKIANVTSALAKIAPAESIAATAAAAAKSKSPIIPK